MHKHVQLQGSVWSARLSALQMSAFVQSANCTVGDIMTGNTKKLFVFDTIIDEGVRDIIEQAALMDLNELQCC